MTKLRDLILVPVIVALLVTGVLIDPAFLSAENVIALLRQQTELSLLVLAEVAILIAGRIDLSITATAALAPALAAGLVLPAASGGLGVGLPEWSAIPVCLAAGALAGALNALLILQFRLPAFAATLGTLILLTGLTVSVAEHPGQLRYLGRAVWLGVPASIWLCTLIFVAAIVFLGLFRHGRSLYAVGGDLDAAKAAGIRTGRVLWLTFLTGGILAALAGMLATGRTGADGPPQGTIFLVFAAAIIGGISLSGGGGTPFGALCGVLTLGLTDSVLRLAGMQATWIPAIYGALVIAALALARVQATYRPGPPAPPVPR
ncbi:MAG TPA: hypothetical protein VF062_05405 [Candidatus Limnocylindrales bacterium]